MTARFGYKTLLVILLVGIVSFAAGAIAVKFSQNAPGSVTVPAANGTIKPNCSTLVDETPTPPVINGQINYDCGSGVSALTVYNATVVATMTVTGLTYTNTCAASPCISLGVFSTCGSHCLGAYTVSNCSAGPGGISPWTATCTFTWTGPNDRESFDYAVYYNGFVNGTTISAFTVSWS